MKTVKQSVHREMNKKEKMTPTVNVFSREVKTISKETADFDYGC